MTGKESVRLKSEHRQPHDPDHWYQESVEATLLLLGAEDFSGMSVWDPACGEGRVLRACHLTGILSIGSDIVRRDSPKDLTVLTPVDFLTDPPPLFSSPAAIISNPPYRDAERFVRRALEIPHIQKVALVLRLAFLESTGRQNLFETTPLARVLVFRQRQSMPPGGRGIKAGGGAIAYAWFVWRRDHVGPPTVGWI